MNSSKAQPTVSNNFYEAYLKNDGEMGKLIWNYNWSESLIGTPDQWPQSLLTTLGIILHSKFPKFLFWGPEHVCFYNDAYRPSLGQNGKHPFALGKKGEEVWPEIWSDIKPLIDEVMDGGEASWSEDQLLPIYRNGQMEDVYWTFSYSPVIGEGGKRVGVYVTCVETTRQINAIRHSEESEQRFRNLIKNATVGVIVLNGPDMVVDIVNKMYCSIIHKTYEEVIGKNIFEVIPETAEYFKHIIQRIRDTGESEYMYEYPYFVYDNEIRKDGFINIVYQPYKSSNEEITGVIVLVHDVTEQVDARKKIEEAEAKARLAITSAQLGVYEVSFTNNEMITDTRFKEIWGVKNGESRDEYARMIHPEDVALRNKAHELALQTGHLNYEARLVWPDNSIHWMKATGILLYDEKGEGQKLVGVIQDITPQKQFSEALEREVQERTKELAEANQLLQQTNVELNQFAYIASHDLQEPLRKIRTFTNLMLANFGEIPEKAALFVNKINSSSERMQTLINDVLKFSLLSKEREKFETVDLNQIVKNVVVDYELLIEQKYANVSVANLPNIEAIPLQMNQLFTNLLSNALKFNNSDRSPDIKINCEILSQSAIAAHKELIPGRVYYLIEFADNGIGFDQENAEQIFTIFQRLHGRSAYEGTGIGLAICKKITLNHHGLIFAKSSVDSGASFTVILPEVQENA